MKSYLWLKYVIFRDDINFLSFAFVKIVVLFHDSSKFNYQMKTLYMFWLINIDVIFSNLKKIILTNSLINISRLKNKFISMNLHLKLHNKYIKKSFKINVFHFWISSIYSNITLNSRVRSNDNLYEWNIFIMSSRIFDMRRSIKKTISSNSLTSCIKKWYILQIVDFFFQIKSKICSRMMIEFWKRRLKNSIASWNISYIRSLSMRRRTKTFIVNWRNCWKTRIWMIE